MITELKLIRNEFSDSSTIGDLYWNGEKFCIVLEDKDRGLTDAMDLKEIESKKVYGKTCIPYGRYQVIINFSNKFQKPMPLLLNVKGYEGIRIHTGNTELSSLGCLILGMAKQKDRILKSQDAFNLFFPKLEEALKTSKVFITIEKSVSNQIIH